MDWQVNLGKSFHNNQRLAPKVLAAVTCLGMGSTMREFSAVHEVPDQLLAF